VRRVLFDEDVPRQLRRDLPEFYIRTAQQEGWSSVKNGELLRCAAPTFDVLLTADKNLQYQQRVTGLEIGIVVIGTSDTRLPSIRLLLPQLREAIANVTAGSVIVVNTA
jgi:predicted nuclease of predicted toxin-antitoxin system